MFQLARDVMAFASMSGFVGTVCVFALLVG